MWQWAIGRLCEPSPALNRVSASYSRATKRHLMTRTTKWPAKVLAGPPRRHHALYPEKRRKAHPLRHRCQVVQELHDNPDAGRCRNGQLLAGGEDRHLQKPAIDNPALAWSG